ncbi:hypothetical protein EDD16DRAFT_1598074 [Pisolithus croceorrhizus]|nr:hypothetical protein EDD16DRAFT_1598074 [Pisolithus croceorrhizus]
MPSRRRHYSAPSLPKRGKTAPPGARRRLLSAIRITKHVPWSPLCFFFFFVISPSPFLGSSYSQHLAVLDLKGRSTEQLEQAYDSIMFKSDFLVSFFMVNFDMSEIAGLSIDRSTQSPSPTPRYSTNSVPFAVQCPACGTHVTLCSLPMVLGHLPPS